MMARMGVAIRPKVKRINMMNRSFQKSPPGKVLIVKSMLRVIQRKTEQAMVRPRETRRMVELLL